MNMLGDEPPYLSVGTEVSAKYKGAFCEAKVRKVDRVVKCKVTFKSGFGSHTVLDNQIKGTLRVGATVAARHPEKKELVEGTITKIQDCSQYTVVFDDGDITTLRRTALCLKSGRHFAESETLDQLPLTHPEHFGNPVVGGRRARRRPGDESSGEEEDLSPPRKGNRGGKGSGAVGSENTEREPDLGKVVCVELGDKKKSKDNWFPGLVVAPNAQDTVRIRVKEEYLVRSFKDGRYFTVPKKETTEFTREISLKVENSTLKTAVEKALVFLDKDELPPHWDRDLLLGLIDMDDSDSDGGLESDSSDDEPREEKDRFVAQLYKFMDDRATPINSCPSVCSQDLDLYKLFKVVQKMNGYNRVSNNHKWNNISAKLGLGNSPGIASQVKHAYKKYLHSFEEFYRKLGCTMVSHTRDSRTRKGRSLIRDKDRATSANVKSQVKTEQPAAPKPYIEKPVEVNQPNTATTPAIVDQATIASTTEENSTDNAIDDSENLLNDDIARLDKKTLPGRGMRARTVSESADSIESASTTPTRPLSGSRKKFPTLKAAPRTKDEQLSGVLSGSLGSSSRSTTPVPIGRPKRLIREASLDEGTRSGDEASPVAGKKIVTERSTTRSLSKEDLIKKTVTAKKEQEESLRRGKSSSKSSDSDSSKKGRTVVSERNSDSENNGKRGRMPKREKSSDSDVGKKEKNVPPEDDATAKAKKKGKRQISESEAVLGLGITKGKRKRGNNESDDANKSRPCLPRSKSVFVGDILKVYYGSSTQSNGIYEAKVVDIQDDEKGEKQFYVHYAGWNSRYDEWITRNKIAENISWTAKRSKAPQKASKPAGVKKKTSSGKAEPVRPTTPSSITSTSSRTKSPASSLQKIRKAGGKGKQVANTATSSRRARRLSGHTDVSMDSQSDCESATPDSETESDNKSEEAEDSASTKKASAKKTVLKRKTSLKKTKDQEETTTTLAYSECNKTELTDVAKTEPQPVTIKVEDTDPPKGRDFDLNEIRSELKGYDKAVKVTTQAVEATTVLNDSETEIKLEEKPEVLPETEVAATVTTESPKPVLETPIEDSPSPVKTSEVPPVTEGSKEDIYEFKEPEPFEFQEVRRSITRVFEDAGSPEKNVSIKKCPGGSPPPLREKHASSPVRDSEKLAHMDSVNSIKKPPPLISTSVIETIIVSAFKDKNVESKSEEKKPLVTLADRKTYTSPHISLPIGKSTQPATANKDKTVHKDKTSDHVLPTEKKIREISPIVSSSPVNTEKAQVTIVKEPAVIASSQESVSLIEKINEIPLLAKEENIVEVVKEQEAIRERRPSTPKTARGELLIGEMTDVKVRFRKSIGKKLKENEQSPEKEIPVLLVEKINPDEQTASLSVTSSPSPPNSPPALKPAQETPPETVEGSTVMLMRPDLPSYSGSDDSDDSSEAEERLVIANEIDDESSVTSNENKSERLTPLNEVPVEKEVDLRQEEKIESKRSPLSGVRLKRIEERLRANLASGCTISAVIKRENIDGSSSTRESDDGEQEERKENCDTPVPMSICDEKEKEVQPDDKSGDRDRDHRVRSLVCEETIPGSPAPKEHHDDQLGPFAAPNCSGNNHDSSVTAASVSNATNIDNTPPTSPPTTPESHTSSVSASPRGELAGLSLDNESSKSHRDSSEQDADDHRLALKAVKRLSSDHEQQGGSPLKRKRHSRKRSDSQSQCGGVDDGFPKQRNSVTRGSSVLRPSATACSTKGSSGSSPRGGSDPLASDDSDDGDNTDSNYHSPGTAAAVPSGGTGPTYRSVSDASFAIRRPNLTGKYNFCRDIPADLDQDGRIAYLENQIQELRKTYTSLKNQCEALDRRRKKRRRKEREAKALAVAKSQQQIQQDPIGSN